MVKAGTWLVHNLGCRFHNKNLRVEVHELDHSVLLLAEPLVQGRNHTVENLDSARNLVESACRFCWEIILMMLPSYVARDCQLDVKRF